MTKMTATPPRSESTNEAVPTGARTGVPALLVVGPQKAGTTWLHELLAHRGDVVLPHQVKETFFFDVHYTRGAEWYARQFPIQGRLAGDANAGDRVARGTNANSDNASDGTARPIVEVAPSYFHDPAVPARVVETCGRIPVVVTLRAPVKRTWSLYVHYLRYGMTDLPFEQAIAAHPEIVDSSRYATHLRRWQDAVGPENVHVFHLEQQREDRDAWVTRFTDLLGLAPQPVPAELEGAVNEASMPSSASVARAGWKVSMALRSLGLHGVVEAAKSAGLKKLFFGTPGEKPLPKPTPEQLQFLHEELAGEIAATERLLGVELPHWKA